MRGYWDQESVLKCLALSLVEMGIPLGVYLILSSMGPSLNRLSFASMFIYLAVFIALTRMAFPEFHTGQIFALIGINGIGVSLLGLLNALGPFFLYLYLLILAGFGIMWISASYHWKKQINKLKNILPGWQRERKNWIEKQIQDRNHFHTFCFECCHFDSRDRTCTLELFTGTVTQVNFPEKSRETYCLYWNVGQHPNIRKERSRGFSPKKTLG
jgi:hypothetical protein